MNDITLRRKVQHAAQLHGVTPKTVVEAVVGGEEPEEIEHPKPKPAAEEAPSSAKKRYLSAWLTMAIVLLCFGGIVWYLLKLADASATAGQTNLAEVKASAAPKPPGPNSFSGLNFSFQYPHEYDQVGRLSTNQKAIEQYTINSKANHRRTIMVTFKEFSHTKLQDDAGYRFRQITPEQYKAEPVQVAGQPAVVMVKLDNSERTLYWLSKGRLLTVSVLFSGGSKEVAQGMDLIIKSLKVKN